MGYSQKSREAALSRAKKRHIIGIFMLKNILQFWIFF